MGTVWPCSVPRGNLPFGQGLPPRFFLRTLLGNRCEEANLDPDNIDFDKRYYYYKFGVVAFNHNENKVCGPIAVEVMLTDEDYLTLLALQLYDRENFCFNQLLKLNPELADRLNSRVEGEIYGWRFPVHVPFAILFDEVRADAEAIDGPMPADCEIFSEHTDEHMFYVQAKAASHVLTITELDIKNGGDFTIERTMNNIDADKVMKHLDASDYEDMLKKLKQNFHEREAFGKIKSWLTTSGFTFEEKESKP